LTPTGQVVADGAIHIFEDHILLGLDRFAAEAAFDQLSRRIIMEDVAITPHENQCFTVVGDSNGGLLSNHVVEANADFFGELPQAPRMSEDEYRAERILAGVPVAGRDYDTKTLAMELGTHFIETRIAFEKGCYTGQEIVERIRSRGRTHKTFIGLQSTAEFDTPSDIRITSAAYSDPHGHIALAFAPVELSAIGARVGNAVVTTLPFPRGPK
jgi:folate-binding protein YgfZ